jgi:transposase
MAAVRQKFHLARCSNLPSHLYFQVIWLLARGHTISQVSETTAYGERWIEQLLARYNAEGPEALGDLRRRNGASATILKPGLLAKLRLRLTEPPPDGGLWSSRKVADWMAHELGLKSVAPQRGWEALKAIGWSIQKPRPKNPKSASPEEAAAFKKSSRMPSPKRRQSTPASRSRSSPRTSTALA